MPWSEPYSDGYSDIYNAGEFTPPALELSTLTVELGLTANALDSLNAVVWTDVTSYATGSASWERGRTHELSPIQAGTAAVRLDNSDGRFDPMNTTGPYWPNLKPMRRLRLSLTKDGTTYRQFTGYIDSFQIIRPNEFYSEVEVKATDAFKLLNLVQLRDPYEKAVLNASPRAFFRFRDLQNASSDERYVPVADSSGAGYRATLYNPKQERNNYVVGFEPVERHSRAPGKLVLFWDTPKAVASTILDSEYAGYGIAPQAGHVGAADWSISFIYQRPIYHRNTSHGSVLVQAQAFASSDPGGNWWLLDGPDDWDERRLVLKFRVYNSGTEIIELVLRMGHFQGSQWHPHFFGTENLYQVIITRSGMNFAMYAKNLNYPDTAPFSVSGTAAANPSFNSRQIWIATAQAHQFTAGIFYTFPGLFGELATYPTVLTSAQRDAIFEVAAYRWGYQDPGIRIGHVLNQVGAPVADRALEVGSTQLAEYDSDSSESVLKHILDVAATEDGIFFVNGAGVATFYGRHHLITSTRSSNVQMTFGDNDIPEIPYEAGDLSPTLEEDSIYNEAIIERKDGLAQRAEDTASIVAYGRRTLSESGLIAASDNDMAARAAFKVSQYAAAVGRVRTLTYSELDTVSPDITASYPPALGVELWDRVMFRQRLAGAALWQQDSIVEGIRHRYDAESRQHKVTLHLSSLPASLSSGGFWVLGVSQLDINAKVAY